ncbi:DNA polymerase III subunit beta [Caldithrix abyssi]|uniref:Beta sliding clamp n=1 Tax=Caldithrix abyssi DSM 13497 TaxID=880073 RepID=H1XV75_CALAY|nr:DNA polymerase III subunit beta [Caldithrix abyssi]APF16753.1 DNA polymerase III, beta subunit [Caldithrix abyssi DSM 13497]EHO40581.1 DNA polymerase III, beta subunit [Caldithrix abyssi DSM 13497]
MEFTIERSEFLAALQRVINVVPTKTTKEILYNVLLIAEDNQLKIIATDLDITQISWARASVSEEGAVAVLGKLLLDILREMPEIEIKFHVEENFRVQMETSMGHYKLLGEPRTEFPSVPMVDKENSISLPNDKMKKMIERTIFACSTEPARPALTGVLCQIFEEEYRMVATDGHRLVRFINKNFQNPGFTKQYIVPTKALNFVARNLPEEGQHQLFISNDHILFELPNTKIYSRLITDPYPDYERVIPDYFQKEMIINREDLIHSVKRVSLFANPMTYQIRLQINPDNVTIMAQDIDFGGEASETIPCRFDYEPLLIAYNANYLLDLLRHMDAEQIRVMVEDADGPGLLFPLEQEEDEDILMLIMPVRLSEAD